MVALASGQAERYSFRTVSVGANLLKEASAISKAENGGSIYPSSNRKIASALGVEPSDLAKAG